MATTRKPKFEKGTKVWVEIGKDTYKGKVVDVEGTWTLVRIWTGPLSVRRMPIEKKYLRVRK